MSQDLAGHYQLRYEPGQPHILIQVKGVWQVVSLSPSEVPVLARILEEATHD